MGVLKHQPRDRGLVWMIARVARGNSLAGQWHPAITPLQADAATPKKELTGITQHRFSHHPLSFATTHGRLTPHVEVFLGSRGSPT
jgi:hypothetical protein